LPASLPAHVQKNIAFAGLMNSVHSVRYGCDFADVLCRFSSRVSCRGPDDLGQIFNLFSKLHAEKSEEGSDLRIVLSEIKLFSQTPEFKT